MSFIDRWKEQLKIVDNNSTVDTGKNVDIKATFEDFAKKLKSSSEIEKIPLGFMLEKIIPILNENNSIEIKILLEKLWQTNSYDEINKYIWELEVITSKYEKDKDKTVSEWKWFLDNAYEWVKGYFFESKTLNDIQDISIDWKVDSIEEFNKKLLKLISVIEKDSKFKELSKYNQNKIISWLKKLWSWLEEEKNKTLDFLDDKINGIAEQIEKKGDWVISINIEWENVEFNSKIEAFAFIKILKEESENEFQSLLNDFWDFFGATLWEIFTTELPLKPYIWTKDSISDWIENYEDNNHWALLVIDWVQVLLFTLASINYTETLYRRLVTDSLARTWIKKGYTYEKVKLYDDNWKETWETKKVRRVIRIPDYSLGDSYFGWETDVALKNEYTQRVTAIAKLEQQLETIENIKDKNAFAKELNKMKWYLNINTNTFWLKAYSLNKDQWKIKRFINVFINWPEGLPTWLHLRDNATRNIILDKKSKLKLEEWVDFIFKNASINIDEKTGQVNWVNESWESKNVDNIRNYINSISDTDRRKNILDRFDKYIQWLKNFPKWKKVIENDIKNIIENDYLSNNEINKILNKKYFKDLEKPTERWEGFKNWVKEIWDEILYKKDKFNRLFAEKWWKIAPASFTYEKAMAIKLKQIVDDGNWKWSLDDLNEVLKKIDNWKMEINQIYPWYKKFKVFFDSLKWLVWKYWIELPSISELNIYWVSWWNLDDIIKEWTAFSDKLKKAKEIFLKKWEFSENIKHIFNLDSKKFPSENWTIYLEWWKEAYFEQMFNDLEGKSKVDDFRMNQDQVKLEIIKMYNWYLTNDKILSILSNIDSEYLKKDNYKDFIKKVETWKWIWTLEELKVALSDLRNWNDVFDKIIRFNIEDEIKHINEKGQKLGKLSFKNADYWLPLNADKSLNIDSFKENELKLTEFLYKLNWSVLDKRTFNAFMWDIEKGIDFRIKEFYRGLNNSLGINIKIAWVSERSDYLKNIWNQINPYIKSVIDLLNSNESPENKEIWIKNLENKLWKPLNSLSDNEKNMLRNSWVEIDNLIKSNLEFESNKADVKKAFEKSKEDAKKILEKNAEISNKKNALNWLINNIENIKNVEDLNKLQSKFDNIIDNPANILRWDINYDLLIQKFEEKL